MFDLDPFRSALVARAIQLVSDGNADDTALEFLRMVGLPEAIAGLQVALDRTPAADACHLRHCQEMARRELVAIRTLSGDSAGSQGPPNLRLQLHRIRRGEWGRFAQPFLHWCAASEKDAAFDFAGSSGAEIWQYVGLAALARKEREGFLRVEWDLASQAQRFAHAVGFDSAIDGVECEPLEKQRTVSLTRVKSKEQVDTSARRIASLLVSKIPDKNSDLRKTMEYVLVELLRNVVQHSGDRLGGVVAAQVSAAEYRPDDQPGVQIAVADTGIGVQRHLWTFHKDTEDDPRAALTKAIRPHVSGTFGAGRTGTAENAGLGLFFVSEMAKATGGRFLLSSRGASLVIEGDPSGEGEHDAKFLSEAAFFPGTLVVAEIPLALPDTIGGYEGLTDRIRALADERTPAGRPRKWLTFCEPPSKPPLDAFKTHVMVAAPTMADTKRFAQKICIPRVLAGEAICLEFGRVTVLTQSRAHELVFDLVRAACRTEVCVYVDNACPAVRKTLEFVERYALVGLKARRR